MSNPAAGPCQESNPDQAAFVQATVIDPATGAISNYSPLVVDQGARPAAADVTPQLPAGAVVGIWFGYNGGNLTLGGAGARSCVNGTRGSVFGQFAYCNAPAFFKAAHRALRRDLLAIPPIGTATDGRPCPTVRDFFAVDQDQSDNLPTSYLMTSAGMAQRTQANLSSYPDALTLGNPSDNRLVDVALDGALGCTPWKAADLADPGQVIPALPLNELQARARQGFPVALVPAGDPMVLNNGSRDLVKVNAYRRGVDQPPVAWSFQADTARYCRNMLRVAPARMMQDKSLLMPDATHPTRGLSPDPGAADSQFTFLAQRFVASYDNLGCADLLRVPDPISLTTNGDGITTAATINPNAVWRTRDFLSRCERQDRSQDSASTATDTE